MTDIKRPDGATVSFFDDLHACFSASPRRSRCPPIFFRRSRSRSSRSSGSTPASARPRWSVQYSASAVPVLQIALSSDKLSESAAV
jgi:hypothetical protein